MGTNLSFPIWIRSAEPDAVHLAFTLRSVRWIDRWVTIPAYGLVALTGLSLAWVEEIPPASTWLGLALGLFVAAMAVGFLIYAPVSRRRLAAIERGGPGDPAYSHARSQAARLDLFVIPAVLAILALMILRPG